MNQDIRYKDVLIFISGPGFGETFQKTLTLGKRLHILGITFKSSDDQMSSVSEPKGDFHAGLFKSFTNFIYLFLFGHFEMVGQKRDAVQFHPHHPHRILRVADGRH